MTHRLLAIAGAVLASAVLVRADPWHSHPGTYFASQRPSVSQYGEVPKYLTRDNGRLRNRQIIEAAAQRHGVPVAFAKRLVNRESGFNHKARSPVGAMGLTQVMPGTWRSEGCRGNPWNPADNADCGMRYLAKFYRQGGEHYAALRYHGGPNTRAHGPKTRAYAAAVARNPPAWAGRLQVAWNN